MTKYYVMEVKDESASEFPKNYNWDSPTSSSNFTQYVWKNKEFPPFIPTLEQKIYNDPLFSKVNDFIECSIDQFCISEKVKNILEQYNLPKHKFYPVNVTVPKKLLRLFKTSSELNLNYYAFFYDCLRISDTINFVDFKKTKITAETPAMTIEKIEVNDGAEFRAIPEKTKSIKLELDKYTKNGLPLKDCFDIVDKLRRQIYSNWQTDEIVFNKSFDHSLDIFEIPDFSWMTYVSERLMKKLKEDNVTGLIFSKPGDRQYLAKRPNPKLTWVLT